MECLQLVTMIPKSRYVITSNSGVWIGQTMGLHTLAYVTFSLFFRLRSPLCIDLQFSLLLLILACRPALAAYMRP